MGRLKMSCNALGHRHFDSGGGRQCFLDARGVWVALRTIAISLDAGSVTLGP